MNLLSFFFSDHFLEEKMIPEPVSKKAKLEFLTKAREGKEQNDNIITSICEQSGQEDESDEGDVSSDEQSDKGDESANAQGDDSSDDEQSDHEGDESDLSSSRESDEDDILNYDVGSWIKAKQCSKCNFKCSKIQKMRHHFKTQHRVGTAFVCSCGKTFGSAHFLQKHKWKQHIANKLCSECSFQCCGQKELNIHRRIVHNEGVCKLCSLKFNCNGALHRHERKKHPETCAFECARCFEYFHTEFALHQHIKHVHNQKR